MLKNKLIPVKIKKIIFFPPSKKYGIIVHGSEKDLQLPIIIGTFEAQAIALGIENIKMPRPMTHDLLTNILKKEGLKVDKIVITQLQDDTFYAKLYYINTKNEVIQIDSRPSDAIAIGLRTNSEIFVTEQVMKAAGQKLDLEVMESKQNKSKNPASNIDILDKIHDYQLKMQDAIDAENYELAAEFRDKIKTLENKIHN